MITVTKEMQKEFEDMGFRDASIPLVLMKFFGILSESETVEYEE